MALVAEHFNFLELQTIKDARGCLTVFEDFNLELLQKVERIYFLYNVSADSERGAHAHKALRQLMIPVAGSFIVDLERNHQKESLNLSDPSRALVIEPGTWRNLREFSPGAVCLVLASDRYEEDDYIRDYNEFQRMTDQQYWQFSS